jgi:hypothetical protein
MRVLITFLSPPCNLHPQRADLMYKKLQKKLGRYSDATHFIATHVRPPHGHHGLLRISVIVLQGWHSDVEETGV